MAPPITSVTIYPIKADVTIESPDSQEGKSWKSIVKTILAQQGAQRLHWGRQVENPNLVEVLVDWDTIENHKKLASSPAYDSFNDELRPLLDSPPTGFHAEFTPESPASVFNRTPSGVIEHLIFYLEPSLGKDDRGRWEAIFTTFMKVVTENAAGFTGFTAGWVVEELQYEGSAATAFLATLGWDSVDIHLAYRTTQAFQESIVPIREGCKERVVHHVIFQEG